MKNKQRYVKFIPNMEVNQKGTLMIFEEDGATIPYEVLSKGVDGFIEIVSLDPYDKIKNNNIDIVINEEGKLFGLKPVLWWANKRDMLCGSVMFVSSNDDGETIGLTDSQIETVKQFILENEIVM